MGDFFGRSWVLTMCIMDSCERVCVTLTSIHLNDIAAHCRGEEIRKVYSRLGEIRSILSQDVKVMALTATASKTLREDIMKFLGMKNPVVIAVSPDKANIMYEIVPFVSTNATFGTLAEQQLLIGRAIIFCQQLEDCPKLYRFFRKALGQNFTGSPNTCENRLVNTFHT